MNNKNSKFREWLADHKNTVITIGGVVLVVGVGFAAFKYRKLIAGIIKPVMAAGTAAVPVASEAVKKRASEKEDLDPVAEKEETVAIEPETVDSVNCEVDEYNSEDDNKVVNNGNPYDVSSHIRHLGENRYPSILKRQEAEAKGITLGEHDTIVNQYQKNVGFIDNCEPKYA